MLFKKLFLGPKIINKPIETGVYRQQAQRFAGVWDDCSYPSSGIERGFGIAFKQVSVPFVSYAYAFVAELMAQ